MTDAPTTAANPDLSGWPASCSTRSATWCSAPSIPIGRARVWPMHFTAHAYADLYWVSHLGTQHSANLARDDRATGVVDDSTVVPGARRCRPR